MKRSIFAAAVLASPVSGAAPARADLTEWERSEAPIFRGQYWASDPTVVREADSAYRMVCTCITWPDPVFD